MIELYWKQEQLESTKPEILEEYSGFDVIILLEDTREYVTKYQAWAELEKLLKLAPIKDVKEVKRFLIQKLELE